MKTGKYSDLITNKDEPEFANGTIAKSSISYDFVIKLDGKEGFGIFADEDIEPSQKIFADKNIYRCIDTGFMHNNSQ